MSDAREKAVDRLAKMLSDAAIDDWPTALAGGAETREGRAADAPIPPRNEHREWASAIIAALGLVAVDASLVTRVREVRESAAERCRHDDPGEACDRCRIGEVLTVPKANQRRQDSALVDAVLEQLAATENNR